MKNTNNVKFYKDSHTYFDKDNNEYMGVTKFIEREFGAFDKIGIINKIIKNSSSQYYNMSVDEVCAIWNEITEQGSALHASIEKYIKNKILPDKNQTEYNIVKIFSNLKFNGSLESEILVYDPRYLLAGQIDIIEKLDKGYKIWDLKTARLMDFQKLFKYSVQLELYKRLLEYQTNKPVFIGGILWAKNYSNKGVNTKLKLLKTHPCIKKVTDMLVTREIEVWKIKKEKK